MSTPDSLGDGPPSKKARFGDDSGKPQSQIFSKSVFKSSNFFTFRLEWVFSKFGYTTFTNGKMVLIFTLKNMHRNVKIVQKNSVLDIFSQEVYSKFEITTVIWKCGNLTELESFL